MIVIVRECCTLGWCWAGRVNNLAPAGAIWARSRYGGCMRYRLLGVLLACGLAAGCSSVTTDPTVPAFSSAVMAGAQAFTTARSAEGNAFSQAALNASLAPGGTVSTQNCWQANADQAKCQMVLTVNGQVVEQQAVAVNGAKLAQALSSYAQGLAQLTTAKDITDQQAAEEKLATGLGAIAALAGIPGVGAAGDLLATLQKDVALEDRRAQILAISRQADGTVGSAADLLQQEAVLLQRNIVLNASQTVANEQTELAIAPREQRLAIAQSLASAVSTLQAAASLKIDIATKLKAAHTAMIQSLANPKADPMAALGEIDDLATAFSNVETAFGGTPAKGTKS
jgi:hypothetical protein